MRTDFVIMNWNCFEKYKALDLRKTFLILQGRLIIKVLFFTCIKCFLCARHCSECFICVILFSLHSNFEVDCLHYTHFTVVKIDAKRGLKTPFEDAQLVRSRARQSEPLATPCGPCKDPKGVPPQGWQQPGLTLRDQKEQGKVRPVLTKVLAFLHNLIQLLQAVPSLKPSFLDTNAVEIQDNWRQGGRTDWWAHICWWIFTDWLKQAELYSECSFLQFTNQCKDPGNVLCAGTFKEHTWKKT